MPLTEEAKFVYTFVSMKLKIFIFLIQLILVLIIVPKIQAWWLVDQFGQLINMGSGQVLGDEDRNRKEESKKEERQEQRIEIKNEGKREEKIGKKDIRPEEIKKMMEFKPGEVKREFENKNFKIKMEQKDGVLKIKTKNELTGEETELETKEPREIKESTEPGEIQETQEQSDNETEIMRVREREDKNEVRINSRNEEFVIDRNNVGATTNFPLTVDSQTNALTVTTPSGEKQVTILPDQAVQNMLSRNIIDRISEGETTGGAVKIKIEQLSDGTLVYEMEGEKQERFFGLIPLKFKKTAIVSAETGELVSSKESFADRFLDLLSF